MNTYLYTKQVKKSEICRKYQTCNMWVHRILYWITQYFTKQYLLIRRRLIFTATCYFIEIYSTRTNISQHSPLYSMKSGCNVIRNYIDIFTSSIASVKSKLRKYYNFFSFLVLVNINSMICNLGLSI